MPEWPAASEHPVTVARWDARGSEADVEDVSAPLTRAATVYPPAHQVGRGAARRPPDPG